MQIGVGTGKCDWIMFKVAVMSENDVLDAEAGL